MTLPESKELFTNPNSSPLYDKILSYPYPWGVLADLSELILDTGSRLPLDKYHKYRDSIWISKGATVSDLATLHGPLIIMEGADIRPGAFIRGSAIIGRNTVVGNSTELKNCILFDKVQVPHFNYVGDSILGEGAHLGAGAVTSNVKSDKTEVTISLPGEKIPTGRKKLGAILGDRVEVGCNSVLCPGTIVGRESIIYPLCRVRGFIPSGVRIKS